MKTNNIVKGLLCAILGVAFAAHAEAGPGPRQHPTLAQSAKTVPVDRPFQQIALSCGNCGIGSVSVPVARQFVQRSNGHGQAQGAIAYQYDDQHISTYLQKH